MRRSLRASGWATAVLAGTLGCGMEGYRMPGSAPMHVDGDVKPPRLVSQPDPNMSDADVKLYRQCAQVYLWVEEDGKPSHIKLLKSTGSEGVDAAFVNQKTTSRYKPATLDGMPVKADLYIDMCF